MKQTSSPLGTPKLQLAVEQLSTGECWIPPKKKKKKKATHPRANEKPQENGMRVKLHLDSNPKSTRGAQRAQTKCGAHQETIKTEPDLPLSV